MNLDDPAFVAAFAAVVRQGGRWRNCEPSELIAQYLTLVSSCVSGFRGDVEDYFNELTSRSDLAEVMNAPELLQFSQMIQVLEVISRADMRFREVLLPDVFPKFPVGQWWNRGVVRYAGPRFVKELREMYGVEIELVEPGSK